MGAWCGSWPKALISFANIFLSGQPGTFVVKLKNSQSGILRVAINGPSTPTDVALKCSEMSDGYEFTYVPSVNGIHFVCVEFGDRHVAGSPFKVHVTGA